MAEFWCHSCIHQQNWIKLFRFLLRMSAPQQELEKIGFVEAPVYEKASKKAFYSREHWDILANYLDEKLPKATEYIDKSIVQLLGLWSKHVETSSKEQFLNLLWALLRRRDECPYRICSKLLRQLEDISLHYLLQTRNAS
jgi:hypothetical protein